MNEQSKGYGSAPQREKAPRLMDLVHQAIRRRYYSRRTEEAYAYWIRCFIFFHGKRHPRDMGEIEVTAFLNHLAVVRKVAAGTQNQALSALLFLFKEVLEQELPWLDGLQRATRPPRLPTVLTRGEAEWLVEPIRGHLQRVRALHASDCATRSPRTCSKAATTSAPCRNCSAIRTSRPR